MKSSNERGVTGELLEALDFERVFCPLGFPPSELFTCDRAYYFRPTSSVALHETASEHSTLRYSTIIHNCQTELFRAQPTETSRHTRSDLRAYLHSNHSTSQATRHHPRANHIATSPTCAPSKPAKRAKRALLPTVWPARRRNTCGRLRRQRRGRRRSRQSCHSRIRTR